MTIKNITEQFDDVNAYDRVYQADNGYAVKVRVRDVTVDPTRPYFQMTGVWADEKTGKARLVDEQLFMVTPHEVGAQSDAEADIKAALEAGYEIVVTRVQQAAANHFARTAIAALRD